MTAKICPACEKGPLFFAAGPMPLHDDVITVQAACAFCDFVFLYHFPFEEMLIEMVIEDKTSLDNDHLSKKRGNVTLVKK